MDLLTKLSRNHHMVPDLPISSSSSSSLVYRETYLPSDCLAHPLLEGVIGIGLTSAGDPSSTSSTWYTDSRALAGLQTLSDKPNNDGSFSSSPSPSSVGSSPLARIASSTHVLLGVTTTSTISPCVPSLVQITLMSSHFTRSETEIGLTSYTLWFSIINSQSNWFPLITLQYSS